MSILVCLIVIVLTHTVMDYLGTYDRNFSFTRVIVLSLVTAAVVVVLTTLFGVTN